MLAGIGSSFPEALEPAAMRKPLRPERAAGQAISVLLVEDNDVNALLARRLLEKAGCGVRACGNGREAVEAFRQILTAAAAPVDLVLMDVHMPVLDGLEACRAIRQLHAAHGREPPPVIAVTANAFEEDRRLCLEAGMDDYLAKPFDRDDLGRVLERWCGGLCGATRAA
jgi:CheY-like chemotaxis protein